MGLFSAIKKVVKGVVKGVAKVFKPVTKFIGKLTQKKWFKWLMIGATVFTAGVALYAGVQGFMAAGQAGQTLLGRFVTGGTEFLKALLSPVQTAQDIMSGTRTVSSVAEQLNAANAAKGAGDIAQTTGLSTNPADALSPAGVQESGAVTQAAAGPGASATAPYESGMFGPSPAQQVGQAAQGGVPAAGGSASMSGGSVLPSVPPVPPALEALPAPPGGGGLWGSTKDFLGGVSKFAQTTGGGMLLGQMLQGYGAGKAEEEYWKRADRTREEWRDPDMIARVREQAQRRIRVPEGYPQNAVAQPWNIRQHYGYPPTVGGPSSMGG